MDGLDGFVADMATQRLVGVAFEGVDLVLPAFFNPWGTDPTTTSAC
jgi:hypothetical protein